MPQKEIQIVDVGDTISIESQPTDGKGYEPTITEPIIVEPVIAEITETEQVQPIIGYMFYTCSLVSNTASSVIHPLSTAKKTASVSVTCISVNIYVT